MSLPHRKETVEPTRMEGGLLGGVFNARAPQNPDPATIVAADRAFEAGKQSAADATARRQAAADAGHARYVRYEGVLEESYKSRGMQADLDRMSFGSRKGLVNAAAHLGQIFEVGAETDKDIESIASNRKNNGLIAIESAAATADRRLEELKLRIAGQIAKAVPSA